MLMSEFKIQQFFSMYLLEAVMLTKKAVDVEVIFESNKMIPNDASVVMMFSVEEMFFFSANLTAFR
jgi:hypothetical protein